MIVQSPVYYASWSGDYKIWIPLLFSLCGHVKKHTQIDKSLFLTYPKKKKKSIPTLKIMIPPLAKSHAKRGVK